MERTDLLNVHRHDSIVGGNNTRHKRKRDHKQELKSTQKQTASVIPSSKRKRRTKSHSQPRNQSRLFFGANEIIDDAPSSNKDGSIVQSRLPDALPEPPKTSRKNAEKKNGAGNDTIEIDVKIKNIMDELNKYEQRIKEVLNGFQEPVKQMTEFALQSMTADIFKLTDPVRDDIPSLKKNETAYETQGSYLALEISVK